MKPKTTVLYARVPVEVKAEIDARAEREQRTISAVVTRMLTHAVMCENKIIVTDEL